MTAADLGLAPVHAPAPFRPFHKWDRNFFAVLVALIWLGIVTGFGSDMIHHIRSGERAYPLIVHFHAAAFVGWLVLLTVQVALVRGGRADIHRKLGLSGMALAGAMVVLGPATAILVQRADFGTSLSDPAFFAIQFTDILAFAGLVTTAFLLRKDPTAHKRLMLLATLYISDAGFARFLGDGIAGVLGPGVPGLFVALYGANDLLILGLGGYDLVTRRRLHPVYLPALAFIFANQLAADLLYHLPQWKPVAMALIGH
jgi:hypothetical protein